MIRCGDEVEHPRFGRGVVTAIDGSVYTYSVPMLVARYACGEIIRPLCEVRAIKPNEKDFR